MNQQQSELGPLVEKWAALWAPPEQLTLSEWAELNFVVSGDYGRRKGQLELFGWQRGIFDAFTDPSVETIVLMCGTQLVKTLFIQAALSYAVAERPGPVLLVQPNGDDAEKFSKNRLAPMIRDNKLVRDRLADVGSSRTSANTITSKKFDGGSLSLVGAHAPGGLAGRSIRYLFCDEVDKYPPSAGAEGDPISLALERTVTYRDQRKIILTCSPTVKGVSRIEKAFNESDQRKPWVPCWQCGKKQVLRWAQVHFDKTAADPGETALYQCEHCDASWNDMQRWTACRSAEWRAERPFHKTAGFWISGLYSPWKLLGDIVRGFLQAKSDRQQLKVFVNTNLAELWEEEGSEVPIPEILAGRSEDYPCGPDAVIPRRAVFLTCGVDVQKDRLEYEVVAWGREKESWSVEYGVIRVPDGSGDWLPTSDHRVWLELDKVLARDWEHQSGARLPIIVMAIDTGNASTPVTNFARRHAMPNYAANGVRAVQPRTVVPIKGAPTEAMKIIATVSSEDAARKRYGIRIVSLGQGVIKQEFYESLKLPPMAGPSPGACHFPRAYRMEYFEGLCSERRIVDDKGKVSYQKIDTRRNEPLDCRVYARGAAAIFGIDYFTEKQWSALAKMLGITETVNQDAPEPAQSVPADAFVRQPAEQVAAAPAKPVARPRVIRSSWLNR